MVATVDATTMEFIKIGLYNDFYAVFIIFPLFCIYFVCYSSEFVVKLSVSMLWSDTFRRVRKGGWNLRVAWGACCLWAVYTDLPILKFMVLH